VEYAAAQRDQQRVGTLAAKRQTPPLRTRVRVTVSKSVGPLGARVEERVRDWNVVVQDTVETESSVLVFGSRGPAPAFSAIGTECETLSQLRRLVAVLLEGIEKTWTADSTRSTEGRWDEATR